jgi:hypothetical protein
VRSAPLALGCAGINRRRTSSGHGHTGKLDGGALKGAADCGGMLQSDWNNKRGN